MFAAGRAFEQVRNSVGYPKNNVKIGATHAGISVGEDGATHQCNEDIALMRTIPGMVVISPADDVEARAAVFAAYEHQGPVYMRFGRLAVPVINDNLDYKFETLFCPLCTARSFCRSPVRPGNWCVLPELLRSLLDHRGSSAVH